MTLHRIPLNFLIYEENFIFFFISVLSIQALMVAEVLSFWALDNQLVECRGEFGAREVTVVTWDQVGAFDRQATKVNPSFKKYNLKVHKIENFFDSDFGICVISLLVISKY
jgi:hypothetical protein